MFKRILRALKLDASLYEEVEADPSYDRESWLIVGLIAVIAAVLSIFGIMSGGNIGPMEVILLMIAALIGTIGGFLVSVLAIWLTGSMLGGHATFGEMRRSLAYAYSPLILAVVPCVNVLAVLWFMATSFVAVRQTLDISNGRTLVVVIIAGFVLYFVLGFLAVLGLGGAFMFGGLG